MPAESGSGRMQPQRSGCVPVAGQLSSRRPLAFSKLAFHDPHERDPCESGKWQNGGQAVTLTVFLVAEDFSMSRYLANHLRLSIAVAALVSVVSAGPAASDDWLARAFGGFEAAGERYMRNAPMPAPIPQTLPSRGNQFGYLPPPPVYVPAPQHNPFFPSPQPYTYYPPTNNPPPPIRLNPELSNPANWARIAVRTAAPTVLLSSPAGDWFPTT